MEPNTRDAARTPPMEPNTRDAARHLWRPKEGALVKTASFGFAFAALGYLGLGVGGGPDFQRNLKANRRTAFKK